MTPFHLSFAVHDLSESKAFYIDVLGCSLGRDEGSWIDILFSGHQVTIHQESEHMKAIALDHFGPILDRADWLAVLKRCQLNDVEFVLDPVLRNEGMPDESGKFMVLDPAGNVLEFKFFRSQISSVPEAP